ncbi:MAG: hypothetical protein ACOX44_10820 [Limnochordia bacterium]|jgi:hypothetical protein
MRSSKLYSAMQRWLHTLRICWSAHIAVLLVAICAATVGIIVQCRSEAIGQAVQHALNYAEVVLPLVAMALTCHIFTVDRDQGFMELLRTYPGHRMVLVLERMAAGWLYVILGVGLALVALGSLTPVPARYVTTSFAPPSLLLMGLGLLVAALSHSWITGLATGAVYWLWEMITRGNLTGMLFLFPESMLRRSGSDLVRSRMAIALVGLALLCSAVITYWDQLRRQVDN